MPSHSSGEWRSPEQVSDIQISKTWQVECPDHGVIDERPTYALAVAARRKHWFGSHRGEGGESR